MVQYVIKSKGNIDEWSIVELQGELEIRNGGQNFDEKYFGDLHYKNGKPVLILGIDTKYNECPQINPNIFSALFTLKLKLNVKRAPVMSMFIDGLPLEKSI